MKRRKLAIIAISVLLLAATGTVATPSVITEDAFAKSGKYTGDTSQAASVSNECLNPILDSNSIDNIVDVGNCAGTVSQQDESGSASAPITSQTANPTIELQRATTTQPPPPTEEPPGPEGFGTVEFSVGLCDRCPPSLNFVLSTNPSEFSQRTDPAATTELSFTSPSTFEIRLQGGAAEFPRGTAIIGTGACSSVAVPNELVVRGNIPPAGTTVTCQVSFG